MTRAKKIDRYVWKTPDGVEYRLTDIPTSNCHKCGGEIGDDEYCYFRQDSPPEGELDHVCWDCGDEVTDFAG